MPGIYESHYVQPRHKSRRFYEKLAAACDDILAKHPVGTNEVIAIPVTDPTLPQAAKNMQPLKIKIYPQGVWMLLDSDSRHGIGLGWQPKLDDTNFWTLDIVAEGMDTVIYSVKRSKMPAPGSDSTRSSLMKR